MPVLSDAARAFKGRAKKPKAGPEVGPGDVVARDSEGRTPAPGMALKRISRGDRQLRRHEPRWRELWAHFDGEQFTEVSAVDGSLVALETRDGGLDKPRYRSRLVRNRMTKGITAEVSLLTSRFPVPECTPIN